MDLRKYIGRYINISAIEAYPYHISPYSLFDNTCELSINVEDVPARRIGTNLYCLNMTLTFTGQVKKIRRDRRNSWDGDFMNVRFPDEIERKANDLLDDLLIGLHYGSKDKMSVASWQSFLLRGLFNRAHNTALVDSMAFVSGALSDEGPGLAIWYNHDHSVKVSFEYDAESFLVSSLKCEASGGNLTIAQTTHSEFCNALKDYIVLSYKGAFTPARAEPVNVAEAIQPLYDWLDNRQVLAPELLFAVTKYSNSLEPSVIHQMLCKIATSEAADDEWVIYAMLIPALLEQKNTDLADEDVCLLNQIENRAEFLTEHYMGNNRMACEWAYRVKESIKQYKESRMRL